MSEERLFSQDISAARKPSLQQLAATAKSGTHRRSFTATAAVMSAGSKSSPTRRANGGGENGGGGGGSGNREKAARYDRCFSGLELRIGPGPLGDMDAARLKGRIRKWARAVVAYARQLSFGSPRSRPASSPTSGGGDTPRSAATLPASKPGRLGGDKNEPPT